MSRPRHYILIGRIPVAVSLEVWARWFEKADRTLARDVVGDAMVSTVFLGLDHNFTEEGPALLFETMIFDNYKASMAESYCDRYATWADAEKGHGLALAKLKRAIDGELGQSAGNDGATR